MTTAHQSNETPPAAEPLAFALTDELGLNDSRRAMRATSTPYERMQMEHTDPPAKVDSNDRLGLPPPAVVWQHDLPLRDGGAVSAGRYWTESQLLAERERAHNAERVRIAAAIRDAWHQREASHGNRSGEYHEGMLAGLDAAVALALGSNV